MQPCEERTTSRARLLFPSVSWNTRRKEPCMCNAGASMLFLPWRSGFTDIIRPFLFFTFPVLFLHLCSPLAPTRSACSHPHSVFAASFPVLPPSHLLFLFRRSAGVCGTPIRVSPLACMQVMPSLLPRWRASPRLLVPAR